MSKKKIKHLIISSYYRAINPFRKLYWFIFRPKSRGVKGIIFWEEKVLLVRLSYGHKGWTFPGGGVDTSESFQDAVLREVKEEVGVEANDTEFFYEYHSTFEYKDVTVQCFAMTVSSPDFVIDEQEIVEATWFLPDALPTKARPSVKEILLKYSEWKQGHA